MQNPLEADKTEVTGRDVIKEGVKEAVPMGPVPVEWLNGAAPLAYNCEIT